MNKPFICLFLFCLFGLLSPSWGASVSLYVEPYNAETTSPDTSYIIKAPEGPRVKVLKAGENDLVRGSVISTQPEIKIEFEAENRIDLNSLEILLNKTALKQASLVSQSDVSLSTVNALYTPEKELSPGTYELTILVKDEAGNLSNYSIPELKVYGALVILDTPMNYPNPLKPSSGQSTTIRYQLSQATDIKLFIYNLAGQLIFSRAIAAGEEGGNAGYNRILWDGKDSFGQVCANGAYVYFITSQGKPLGSGEIAIHE